MKNKLSMLVVVLFLVAIGVSGAFAYDITITPGGAQDVSSQSTIYFDIVFNPDAGGNVLNGYDFKLFYDTGELTWNLGSTTTTPPGSLTEVFGVPKEDIAGLIENFNGLPPIGVDPPIITAPVILANVAFDVSPGVNNPADGFADIWFDTSAAAGSFTIDGNYVPLSQAGFITGASPDIYVLPEPISMILFITGGATFGIGSYWRKRKQRLA